ncbi:MAG: anti-sigma factor antagonist [Planctomycetota bacterium]|nr:MAG: anti-sigma factor antagonist [Planctomycetota bacterium]
MKKLNVNTKEVASGIYVVEVIGFVDRHTLDTLDKALADLLEAGKSKIIVHCEELNYISSNGMGVFISHLQAARQKGGDIRFCNMKDIGKTVITVLGLHNLFQIFDTLDEAVASYQSA